MSKEETVYGMTMRAHINSDEEAKEKGSLVTDDTRYAGFPGESFVPLEAGSDYHAHESSHQPLSPRHQPDSYTSVESNAAAMLMDEISKDTPEMTSVVVDCKFLVDLNHKGMAAMSQGKYERARKSLRLCELLATDTSQTTRALALDDRRKIYALTMNNLGCYYKKIKKPNVALKYMVAALNADITNKAPKSHIASTQLNICAILSQLGKHLVAAKYAQEAISHLESTLSDLRDPTRVSHYSNVDERSLLATVAIAYYNLGAECEHSNDLIDALEAYERVVDYAQQCDSTDVLKFAKDAKRGLEKKLNELEGALSRRSVMRDEGSVMKAFHDSVHIARIDLDRMKRGAQHQADSQRQPRVASQMQQHK